MDVKNVLISFVGARDPFNQKKEDGPLLSILSKSRQKFQKLILLYTSENGNGPEKKSSYEEKAKQTIELVESRFPKIETEMCCLKIPDPTSHENILSELRKNKIRLFPSQNQQVEPQEYFISISSGTPQMHACWLLLTASGEVIATVLQIREKPLVKKGQPLISEINPMSVSFPVVRQRVTMAELPDVDEEIVEKVVSDIGIIYSDALMKKVIRDAVKVASCNLSVLITGETGTGKEKLAHLIHNVSRRCDKRIIPLNCSAIPENLMESELFGHKKGSFTGAVADKDGLFKVADGGTLFLDEIGEMPMAMQSKMLRALETHKFKPVGADKEESCDVWIIAATNRNLKEEVMERRFRDDLFYRLNQIPIHIPPLRERPSDILPLVKFFMDAANNEFSKNTEFSMGALRRLKAYHWPGNIRELKNIVKRLVALSETDLITEAALDAVDMEGHCEQPLVSVQLGEGFDIKKFIEDIRVQVYKKAISESNGKHSDIAALLGVSPAQVYDFRKRHGL